MKKSVPIQVEVFLSPAHVDELSLRKKNVIVIDALRASTTIATALFHGAREIIPVATIESAVKVSGSLFGDVTLRGGERNGRVIEGFNLGNSPSEYTEKAVKGKSIIYTTTNGSSALVKGRYAKSLVVAGFTNMSKVVSFLKDLKEDFSIICAGKQNDFSLEDTVCAGMVLARFSKLIRHIVLGDAGRAAISLYEKYGKNILVTLQETDHGKFLTEIGLGRDIALCAAVDSIPALPIMSGNVIKLKEIGSQGAAA
jgi:2-phosphosulfolactate phosphatase